EKLTRSDGAPAFTGQLEITYADGHRTTVASDTTWHSALGPTTFTNWYGGEDYDARRTTLDWRPALRAEPPAAPLTAPDPPPAPLTARDAPPVTVVDPLRARKTTEPKPGVYVVDLGVNFAGWERLRLSGPAGTTITMRPGELLNADGTVSQATTGSPIWDTYT